MSRHVCTYALVTTLCKRELCVVQLSLTLKQRRGICTAALQNAPQLQKLLQRPVQRLYERKAALRNSEAACVCEEHGNESGVVKTTSTPVDNNLITLVKNW